MSNIADMGLDLDNLFQPAWAQGKSEANRFEKFTGDEGVRPERRRGPGGDRPNSNRGPRRDGGGGGGGGGGDRRGGPPPARGGSRFGDRKYGDRRGGPGGPRRDDRRDDRQERPEPLAPLPELSVAFVPEEKGVEQLARQIRMTGRAYPLFQIAQLILEKAERYSVHLASKKKADGTAQQIFVCALDDTPWTSEEEAVAHVLKHHFATFYQVDRTPCEPPKGVYTFVAQCGMSGVILGPPNYHDYQNQLRKLHTEKFSRMPFDMFKARVKIVKDEAVVKKWIEDQSFKTEYSCLNVPEPLKLATLEDVNLHFCATHKDSIIKPVESYIVAGAPSRALKCSGLQRLIRQEWEHQRHFPLPIATKLSQQFATHGLQFFKVNKTVTHVSVARPQYLDIDSSPVSDGIRRIVQYINANAKCTRKKLVEALAPTPKLPKPVILPIVLPETPAAAPAAEGTPAAEAAPVAPVAPAAPAKPAEPEPTPEQTAVMVDLHWLIHQGAVLEFADGRMETAKKPLPKPVRPEKKAEEKPAAGTATTATEATETAETAETAGAATETPAPEPTAVETVPAAEVATPVETATAVEPVAEAAPVAEAVITPEAAPAPAAPGEPAPAA